MKFLDRFTIVLFNFCLLLLTIIVGAVCVAGSTGFYKRRFEKTGIYDKETIRYVGGGNWNDYAEFTDEQIDEMIEHIVSFLFTDQESFELVMDDVCYKGVQTDGVSVFGETSVTHMQDVKELFRFFIYVACALGVLAIGSIGYFVWRRKEVKKLFLKYTLFFYGGFVLAIGLFCGYTLIVVLKKGVAMSEYTRILWQNCHYLFFPFQADKFAGSFFADPLTEVLTLDFFMGAVITVLVAVAIVLCIWLSVCVLCKISEKKKQRLR